MIVIGLTGGIGSGKSEVARMLESLGAEIIDADRIGHQAYLPNTDIWKHVVERFGEQILQSNCEIDRKKLGAIVFSDPMALAQLNSIVHPRIYDMINDGLVALRNRDTSVAVVEAAVLIEAGWVPLVDEVWVTESTEDTVVDRVGRRSGLSAEQIRSRTRSQLAQGERARYATVVLENNHGLKELREQVQKYWDSNVQGRPS